MTTPTPMYPPYPADYPNVIAGWYFPDRVIKTAHKNSQMLVLDLEVGKECHEDCCYCFERGSSFRREEVALLQEDRLEGLIQQASSLGVKSVKIVGAGEPLYSRNILPVLEKCASNAMDTVLFTAGEIIADDSLCQNLHNCGSAGLLQRLHEYHTSVVVKYNSQSPKTHDRIVGRKGSAARRDRALHRLVDSGFNDCVPTRLGVDCVIISFNKDEVYDIYTHFKEQNIHPVVNTLMPCGLASPDKNFNLLCVNDNELRSILVQIYSYNKRCGIEYSGMSSYIGSRPCFQLSCGVHVTFDGRVKPCPGTEEIIGDVTRRSLADIWLHAPHRIANQGKTDNRCPYRHAAGSLRYELYDEMDDLFAT